MSIDAEKCRESKPLGQGGRHGDQPELVRQATLASRQAEIEVHSLPEEPEIFLDASDDAAAMVDGGGRIIAWTRNAESLLGYSASQVLGRCATFLTPFSENARAAGIAQCCRSGRSWRGEISARHRDGRHIEFYLQVSAFRMGTEDCYLLSARKQQPQRRLEQFVLDNFLSRSPAGMAALDSDLRYTWLNDTLERFGGVPREQCLGRRPSEINPGLQTNTLENLMREVIRSGEPVIDYEYEGWSQADPHRTHGYSTSFYPLVAASGAVTGVYYIVLDVTDSWNTRRLLSMVSDAEVCVGTTLDVMKTAQELADFTVPRFADFAIVDLLEPVFSTEGHGAWLSDAGPSATRPIMRRAGMSSVREGCPEAVAQIGDRVDFIPPPHDLSLLINGDPVLLEVLDPNNPQWMVEQPRRSARMREFGMHSLISVPMRARDTVLGLATFVRSQNPNPFEPDDVMVAQEVVARAAVCVDNARRYTREHTSTLTLQRSLLPHALAGGTAIDVASRYRPADATDGVGGDWFDVIPLSGARVGLVVGDVVGHGINAAATMGRLRTAVRTLAALDLPPDELLAHLDDLVLSLDTQEGPKDADSCAQTVLGATCLYAIYDPVTQHCTLARAGHPPPIIVSPHGSTDFADLPAGPPLGLGGMPFESVEIDLPAGSLIGFYTDGLVTGSDQDIDLGMSRLAHALTECDRPLEELCGRALAQLPATPHRDDVALLLARTHALSDDDVVSWDVETHPSAVAKARAQATCQLEEWGLEDLIPNTELIVSELVTNAIRYGHGRIRLRLLRQSCLITEVADASCASPRLRHSRTTDEGGRGLFLVAQVAHRWGARHTAEGKVIWAEQEFP